MTGKKQKRYLFERQEDFIWKLRSRSKKWLASDLTEEHPM